MEAKHFILPTAALVLALVLLGGQRKRISELRSGNEELHGRIAAARTATPTSDRAAPRDESVDWGKLAEYFRENPGGQPPEIFSIQRRLLAMEPAELLAELDGITAMKLDDATRETLETMILDPLCINDAEAALDRFKGIFRNGFGQQTALLFSAFELWMRHDPAATEAWMTREVAAGTFETRSLDGKNSVRVMFESVVVFGLFAEDPAKAEARLSGLPQELRAGILRLADFSYEMEAGDEIAYAEIVRRQLDEKGRVAAISGRARRVVEKGGDFAAVDEYLNSVYAAPDERERAAAEVARRYAISLVLKNEWDAAKIAEMRVWVGRDAPDAVGRLTGETLGLAADAGGMGFAEAAALALFYRQSDGDDAPLHAFLSRIDPVKNRAEARKLAETISDPVKREELLRRFE